MMISKPFDRCILWACYEKISLVVAKGGVYIYQVRQLAPKLLLSWIWFEAAGFGGRDAAQLNLLPSILWYCKCSFL